ncbi:MAG: mandelate racemase/muconate lactonizing enzyme family protein [Balneolaceae bacterium]
MSITIRKTCTQFEREPLVRPFGFKGGYMNRIWQIAVRLESDDGDVGLGIGTQNVLWSDRNVFLKTAESGGNCLMVAVTDFALQLIRGTTFENPMELQEQIFEEVYDYARTITGLPGLSKTFVLNALVPVDNAAWVLHARANGHTRFDEIIPDAYRAAFAHRHEQVASIPIASYGMPLEEVRSLVEREGYFILKFKLGSPGDQEEMLQQDMARVKQIHDAIGHREVTWTDDGKLPYYFDMNGRYESKEILQRLLDYAGRIGALDQIRILEEPFPEVYREDVHDLGVMIAADESAHTAQNVEERISMGYGAIALKAVAKTLSMTIRMAHKAWEHSTPCFCADLTVNPVLLEWNRNVAARLAPVPGFRIGLLETNGHQNYRDWDRMKGYHPQPGATWTSDKQGMFNLGEEYYQTGGGIFEHSPHYLELTDE